MDKLHLSLRWVLRIELFALVLALCGLFSIHDYKPIFGPFWNAMHGEIVITGDCEGEPPAAQAKAPIDEIFPGAAAEAWRTSCRREVPYRIILVVSVLIAGLGLAFGHYRNVP